MFVAHKTPCPACPFRRMCAPGWLGADTPEGFMEHIRNETALPCHLTIDYEQEDWQEEAAGAPFCAGALIFMKNSAKLPRDWDLKTARDFVEGNTLEVFTTPQEFLDHHRGVICRNNKRSSAKNSSTMRSSFRSSVSAKSAASAATKRPTKSKKSCRATNKKARTRFRTTKSA